MDDAAAGLTRRRMPLAVPTEPEPEPDREDAANEDEAVAAALAAFRADAAPFNDDDDEVAPDLALPAAPPAAGAAVGG